MLFGGSGNEGVHRTNRSPCSLSAGHDATPVIGCSEIKRQQSTFEPGWKLLCQPYVERCFAPSFFKPLYAVAQFCNGDDAQEQLLFID